MADINTLVDVGADATIIDQIRAIYTGVGKRPVEQVVLTHSHFDHAMTLPQVRVAFGPVVYAQSAFAGADRLLKNGQTLRCGDRDFEAVHVAGHSSDSIWLYCKEDGVLFSGDTPLRVASRGQTHDPRLLPALEWLRQQDVKEIYPGHGEPFLDACNGRLRSWLNEAT